MSKYHTICPTKKWSCRKNEHNIDGQEEEHAEFFWACTGIMGRTVDTAKYLVNLSPLLALFYMSPHEVWFDNNLSFSHIKVFGCDAFVHVPKEKRNKLGKKAIKCMFIGYKEGME
jgi:hypothetical protein